jgi:pimeloyl-ACP methyl ester carboxylesterase
MPTEQLNGIELHYEEYGAGPAIVFLHGAGGAPQVAWFQQIPHFVKNYRCIVIDHRGFGSTTDPDREGPTRFVDDLEVLLDRLGIDRAALIAQSMGGWTALGFAVRNPGRTSALVMCDCVGDLDWPELHSVIEEHDELTRGIPGLDRAYADDYPDREPAMALLMRIRLNAEIFPLPEWLSFNLNESRSNMRYMPTGVRIGQEDLAELKTPTMFLVGEQDKIVYPEAVRMVHERVPGSEYVEVEGCGHSVYWERPDVFNQIVGEFLRGHLSR